MSTFKPVELCTQQDLYILSVRMLPEDYSQAVVLKISGDPLRLHVGQTHFALTIATTQTQAVPDDGAIMFPTIHRKAYQSAMGIEATHDDAMRDPIRALMACVIMLAETFNAEVDHDAVYHAVRWVPPNERRANYEHMEAMENLRTKRLGIRPRQQEYNLRKF